MKDLSLSLLGVLVIGLFLSVSVRAATITNCRPNGDKQTVCTTFNSDGDSHTDYWTNTPGGGSYKSSSFGNSDEN